jgi:hypothetical protein
MVKLGAQKIPSSMSSQAVCPTLAHAEDRRMKRSSALSSPNHPSRGGKGFTNSLSLAVKLDHCTVPIEY